MVALSFFVGVVEGLFWRIVKNKSTEEFESLPYICTLLNSSLWTYYGITKPGGYLVATVNGFGVVVEIIYISLFLIFAPPRMKGKTAILAGILDVGFLAAAVLVTHLALHGDMRIDAIGFLGAGLNIIMMRTVVATKSVEYMPFLLSFFMFLNGGVWTLYAVLVQDWFLGVPNGTGFVLGTLQLVLYAIYRPAKHVSGDLEDGWQSEHLLPSSSPDDNKNEE
ncbi:hypothetical protein RJ639_002238 [Escallonia herrerae]|uniref:Bidirectional sugar transporter SWEET n=1 Tax=Escallonia herrerae TaxID=1293975 RepID=A0AA88XNM0_9ASTE|nr:hypothetical protein RJ639_002238 [Escallonia herrerae]